MRKDGKRLDSWGGHRKEKASVAAFAMSYCESEGETPAVRQLRTSNETAWLHP
jgi:hypothetical protein